MPEMEHGTPFVTSHVTPLLQRNVHTVVVALRLLVDVACWKGVVRVHFGPKSMARGDVAPAESRRSKRTDARNSESRNSKSPILGLSSVPSRIPMPQCCETLLKAGSSCTHECNRNNEFSHKSKVAHDEAVRW